MHNSVTNGNKYELRDQWYPCSPNLLFSITAEKDQNVYTKFIIYAPFVKAVNFRKEFNIKQ